MVVADEQLYQVSGNQDGRYRYSMAMIRQKGLGGGRVEAQVRGSIAA